MCWTALNVVPALLSVLATLVALQGLAPAKLTEFTGAGLVGASTAAPTYVATGTNNKP
jgi:hypothetical protein